ncbi:MAG TPA: hypothetical protein VG591_07425 [Burkholderiales bacterium]|jgi:hypothetical protein|nr:hypothetical protein [Burkholderiales bacterium]
MTACTHGQLPPPPNGEHPIVAIVAVIAIIAAILLITWARFEVHGTDDLEATITEQPVKPKPAEERELDEAVTANRFATGLSP